MLKKSIQLALLVVVPLMTLIGLLNSGIKTSMVYGDSSAPRLLALDARRNGDVTIQLDGAVLISKNFLDFEFDQETTFKTEEFNYEMVCLKTRPTDKVKQLACEFDNGRGQRVQIKTKRQGFIKVAATINVN